jgi:hypothetical protein
LDLSRSAERDGRLLGEEKGRGGSARAMNHEHHEEVHLVPLDSSRMRARHMLYSARSVVPYAKLCISKRIRDARSTQGYRQQLKTKSAGNLSRGQQLSRIILHVDISAHAGPVALQSLESLRKVLRCPGFTEALHPDAIRVAHLAVVTPIRVALGTSQAGW